MLQVVGRSAFKLLLKNLKLTIDKYLKSTKRLKT